jgi:sulfite exporter TauE/SafE
LTNVKVVKRKTGLDGGVTMETFLTHCAGAFSQHGGLLAIFFLGGLMGGFTHCLTMCGPMVACHSLCQKAQCASRSGAAMQWGYHAGRMTVYALLGLAAGLLSRQVAFSPYWPTLSAVMLSVAGTMFVISSLPGCKHPLHALAGRANYVRGVLLGFMPCGMLYAALMMAATLADPISAMLAMILFTLGTMPALIMVSMGASFFTGKWKNGMDAIGRAGMMVNGLSLLVMAVRMV